MKQTANILSRALALAAALGSVSADAARIEEWSVGKQVYSISFDLDGGLFADSGAVHHFFHQPDSGNFTFPGSAFLQLVAAGPRCVFIGDAQVGTIYRWSNVDGFISPTSIGSTSGLGGFAIGPDGNLWFTEPYVDKIGRLTSGGSLTTYPLPHAGSAPWGITTGIDGRIYFVEKTGNRIGRINADGTGLTEFPLPASEANAQPVGIATWGLTLAFTESHLDRIGYFDISASSFSHSDLAPGSNPWHIARGPYSSFFFTERGTNKIGYWIDNQGIAEIDVPTPNSDPYAIAADNAGGIVFSELKSWKMGRLTLSLSGDVNADGKVDVADVFYLINFLFAGGPTPE